MELAYLMYLPIAVLLVLVSFVFFQNPRGRVNQFFALYMVDVTGVIHATMVLATTSNPTLAEVAGLISIAANYILNGSLLLTLILVLFYPHLLSRRYIQVPLLAIPILLLAGLLSDALGQTATFYVRHPALGQGYISVKKLLAGSMGGLMRGWFFFTMSLVLVLLFVAWVRAPRIRRASIASLTGAVLLMAAVMPVIPESPLGPVVPAFSFAIAFALAVARYQLIVPDRVILGAVFHNAGEGMIAWNLDGRVEQVNLAVEQLAGISRPRAVGQPLATALAPLVAKAGLAEAEAAQLVASALQAGEPLQASLQLQPEGTRLALSANPVFDERGRRQGGLLTLRDVTDQERVRHLLTLEQGQRLQLQETTENLRQLVLQLRRSAGSLAQASAEIMATMSQQDSGATEQVTAITQATSTIEQVRAIAGQMAQRSRGVADRAQQTAGVSRAGQQVVAEAIDGIEEVKTGVDRIAAHILTLSEQAQAIGQIINAVNEIAAQSNMLALNAAVEAARAGQAGKGFAVVAAEVRTLAEQSRAATVQVKELLSEIQRGVNATVMATEEGTRGAVRGVQLVVEVGEAILRLTASVEESAQAAGQISAAAEQQLAGMEQIVLAMQNIDRVTTQTVASARQTERAAEDLDGMAQQMTRVVEQYQL